MKVFSHLFDTLVLSRIEYTVAIWACRSFPLLDQIQHNALRFFFLDPTADAPPMYSLN